MPDGGGAFGEAAAGAHGLDAKTASARHLADGNPYDAATSLDSSAAPVSAAATKKRRKRRSKRARRRLREKLLQQSGKSNSNVGGGGGGSGGGGGATSAAAALAAATAQSTADAWTRRLAELFPVSEAVHVTVGNLVPLRPRELEETLRRGAADFSQSQLDLIETILRTSLDQIQSIKMQKARTLEREKVREEIRLELLRQRR